MWEFSLSLSLLYNTIMYTDIYINIHIRLKTADWVYPIYRCIKSIIKTGSLFIVHCYPDNMVNVPSMVSVCVCECVCEYVCECECVCVSVRVCVHLAR